MKSYLTLFISIFLISSITVLTAQTTLSFTSRGDLASVFGLSVSSNFFVDEQTKKVGARASFGFEISHLISDHQAVMTGVEYSISGFDYKKTLIGIDNEVKYSGAYRYDFISLPLGYRWYRPMKKWKLYGQVSMLPMAYLRTIRSSRIVEFGGIDNGRETRSERNENFQEFHLAASTAVGVERSMFKSWTIGLQPTFRVHITSITKTELKERPWTAGLQMSIGKQLGKSRT